MSKGGYLNQSTAQLHVWTIECHHIGIDLIFKLIVLPFEQEVVKLQPYKTGRANRFEESKTRNARMHQLLYLVLDIFRIHIFKRNIYILKSNINILIK